MMTTTTAATQAKVFFHIRFQGTRGSGLWVTGAKFADGTGNGYKVKSVTHNPDRSKAVPMSRAMAEAIAVQYPHCFVSVHTAHDGAVHAEATAYVTARADEARKAHAEHVRQFNQFLAEAIDAVPGLAAVLAGRRR